MEPAMRLALQENEVPGGRRCLRESAV